MASTAYASSTNFHQPTAQRCIDPADIENWVDFNNTMPSPSTTMSRKPSHLPSAMTSPTSTVVALDIADDHQTPVAPSHDYSRFRQTTGIPVNSLQSLQTISESSQSSFPGFSNSGFDDFSFDAGMYDGMGSNSGLPMGGDFLLNDASAMPSFYYPMAGNSQQSEDFVNPAIITKQEEPQNVRFFPGMHAQQAAQAKAQAEAQAQLQRQQQMLYLQQQKQRQQSRASLDPRTEETIARVVNQIRQNSIMSADGMSGDNILPHVARSRKDEEDMDDDERLLNSEEGKKLSSKERRQLRNKVSARAFRSRRKEYIGQLEGELAQKCQEATDFQVQNRALMEENARFRSLAEKLLRHPAFHPFLEDLSRDPELAASLSKVSSSMPQQPQQMSIPPPQVETQHIGMAMMPEPPLDFSGLNLGNNNQWVVPTMGMPTFQQSRVFAVHEITVSEPEATMPSFETKGDSILDRFTESFEEKAIVPEIESIKANRAEVSSEIVEAPAAVSYDFDESDESVTLFATTKPASTPAAFNIELPLSLSAKPHFELIVTNDSDLIVTDARLARLLATMDRISGRVADLTKNY